MGLSIPINDNYFLIINEYPRAKLILNIFLSYFTIIKHICVVDNTTYSGAVSLKYKHANINTDKQTCLHYDRRSEHTEPLESINDRAI